LAAFQQRHFASSALGLTPVSRAILAREPAAMNRFQSISAPALTRS